MENKTKWIEQSHIRAFVLTVIIVAIIGLTTGKVMEANIYLEIGKWIVIAVVAGVCASFLLAPLIGSLDVVRDKLYPEFGKKWWIEWIKNGFKVK